MSIQMHDSSFRDLGDIIVVIHGEGHVETGDFLIALLWFFLN